MGFLLNAMGGPPAPGTPEFDAWCRSSVSFARAYCEDDVALQRSMRYIDGYAGNDSNDGTSPETPWRSVSKVQDDIDDLDSDGRGSDGLRRHYTFTRSTFSVANPAASLSGQYPSTAGLNLSKPFIRLSSWDKYGVAADVEAVWGDPVAVITACKGGYSTWTSAGSGAWYASESTAIYQVIDMGATTNDPCHEYALTRCASLAEVQARTDGGWWWDSGTNRLYIKRYDGSDPNGQRIWGVLDTNGASAGIYITADGCLVENMGVVGFGFGSSTNANQVNQCYCARITFSGDSVALFRGCVLAYGPYHVRGLYGSVAGGAVVWDRCRLGFARYDNASGSTIGNSYNSAGGNEMASIDNVLIGGVIPTTTITGGTNEYNGDSELAHATGSNKIGLHIIHGFTHLDIPKGKPNRSVVMNDLPTPSERLAFGEYRGVWAMSQDHIGTQIQFGVSQIKDGVHCIKEPTAQWVETPTTVLHGLIVGCRFEIDFANASVTTDQFIYNPGSTPDVVSSSAMSLSGVTRATIAVNADMTATVTAVTGTPTGWTSPLSLDLRDYADINAVYAAIAAGTNNQVTVTSVNSTGSLSPLQLAIRTADSGGATTTLVARAKYCFLDWIHSELIVTPHPSATEWAIDYAGYQSPSVNAKGASQKSRFFNCLIVNMDSGATAYCNTPNQGPSFDTLGKQGGSSCCAYRSMNAANEGGARNYLGYNGTDAPVTLAADPEEGVLTSSLLAGGKLPQGMEVRRTYQNIIGDYRNTIGATRRGPEGARRTRARCISRTTDARKYMRAE